MNILFNVMRATLMISKTASALGATLFIVYGIHKFVKTKNKEKPDVYR